MSYKELQSSNRFLAKDKKDENHVGVGNEMCWDDVVNAVRCRRPAIVAAERQRRVDCDHWVLDSRPPVFSSVP